MAVLEHVDACGGDGQNGDREESESGVEEGGGVIDEFALNDAVEPRAAEEDGDHEGGDDDEG